MSSRAAMPLQRRLFLLVSFALLPLAILAVSGVVVLSRQQRAESERSAIQAMRAMVSAVDSELNRFIAAAETLAASRSLDVGELGVFHLSARRVIQSREYWVSLKLSDINGQTLLDTAHPFGAVMAEEVDPASLVQVLGSGQPVVGRVVPSTVPGQPVFLVRVPVFRGRALIYVLTAAVEPTVMLRVIERQQIPAEGLVSILDAGGAHVARSRHHARYLGHAVSERLQQLMAKDSEGWGPSVTLEGQEVYSAFSTSANTGWQVAVGISANDIDAAVRGSYLALALGILLSLVFGGLASALIARRIAEPINALRTAAQAVGRGEPPHLPSTKIPEISEVAAALALASEARLKAAAAREELLHREKLARTAAEAESRAKDEFLAMLGHELRNPLSAISNAVHLLGPGAGEGNVRQRAHEILQRQVHHLARMLDDLLDVGRVMSGKIAITPARVDLLQTVTDAVASLRLAGRIDARSVRIEGEPVWVDADPTRIEQVVTNLLVNAVKYSFDGSVITISLTQEREQAVLSVEDTGVGIEPDLLPRIFDLFAQGKQDSDRAQGGLGIGLTLVRRLVELQGGSIVAESDGRGTGSRFTLCLPLAETGALSRVAVSKQAENGAALHGPCKILLVEDNEDAREMLREALERMGHSVAVAGNGPDGVTRALELRPDVALIDVGLPGFDGFEVARRIHQAVCGTPRPRLIALTGYGAMVDRAAALSAGFDLHIVKPVALTVLQQVLDESLHS